MQPILRYRRAMTRRERPALGRGAAPTRRHGRNCSLEEGATRHSYVAMVQVLHLGAAARGPQAFRTGTRTPGMPGVGWSGRVDPGGLGAPVCVVWMEEDAVNAALRARVAPQGATAELVAPWHSSSSGPCAGTASPRSGVYVIMCQHRSTRASRAARRSRRS